MKKRSEFVESPDQYDRCHRPAGSCPCGAGDPAGPRKEVRRSGIVRPEFHIPLPPRVSAGVFPVPGKVPQCRPLRRQHRLLRLLQPPGRSNPAGLRGRELCADPHPGLPEVPWLAQRLAGGGRAVPCGRPGVFQVYGPLPSAGHQLLYLYLADRGHRRVPPGGAASQKLSGAGGLCGHVPQAAVRPHHRVP